MHWRLILISCALNVAVTHAGSPMQAADPDVALAPFTVTAPDLRPVGDECLERLAAALTSKGVTVLRRPGLDDTSLARARPARWAVLGRIERGKDIIKAELRLMDVSTGDEMRSYSQVSADPKDIVALAARAAERIAVFVKEQGRQSAR